MQTRILEFALLGVVVSAATGAIGFAAYEIRKPHQEQTSRSVKLEVQGANKVYRSCRGLFDDGKLDAKEFMFLCIKDAQKERERKEAELTNLRSTPAKPQASAKSPMLVTPRTADASR